MLSIHDGGAIIDAQAASQTGAMADCVRAYTTAPVPHTTCTLDLPVLLSGFQAVTRVEIHLPDLILSGIPMISLRSITTRLSTIGWAQYDSMILQEECRELLQILARIARDLTPLAHDEAAMNFLVLLSRLGKHFILGGYWVELCGLGEDKATIIRHEGDVMTVDLGFEKALRLKWTV